MSVLAYGFPFDGKFPFTHGAGQLEEDIYWMDFVLQKAGVKLPEREHEQSDEEFDRVHAEYIAAREKFLDDYSWGIEEAGSREAPQYYVALRLPRRSEFSCMEPVDITRMLSVSNDVENKRKLRQFCEILGIQYTEPRWYVVHWDTRD